MLNNLKLATSLTKKNVEEFQPAPIMTGVVIASISEYFVSLHIEGPPLSHKINNHRSAHEHEYIFKDTVRKHKFAKKCWAF